MNKKQNGKIGRNNSFAFYWEFSLNEWVIQWIHFSRQSPFSRIWAGFLLTNFQLHLRSTNKLFTVNVLFHHHHHYFIINAIIIIIRISINSIDCSLSTLWFIFFFSFFILFLLIQSSQILLNRALSFLLNKPNYQSNIQIVLMLLSAINYKKR